MDAKKLLDSLDFSKENIHRQALIYSFANILTLSMLSGFGIKYDMPDKRIEVFLKKLNNEFNITPQITHSIAHNKKDELQELLCINESKFPPRIENKLWIDKDFSFLKDLTPIRAIYSKLNTSTPSKEDSNKELNFTLELDDKKSEKKLKPKNQGLLILNEVNLSNFLFSKSIIKKNRESSCSEKLIGMILLDLAINQAIFCHNYLRNPHGLFVEKENTSSSLEAFSLEEKNKKIDWEDQVYMIWAYAMLHKTLNTSKNKEYFNSNKANIFKVYAFNLLDILKEHEHEIIELDTANLSSFTSCIIETLDILDTERKNLDFVLSLCDELYSRGRQKGFMLSNRHINKVASLASHFKSIEALTDGFKYTNFDVFLNASEQIYNNLNSVWDDNIGLFNLEGKNNIRYSSKSISYILKSLNKLLKTTESSDVKDSINNQLTNFFDSSINGTGLQIPPPVFRKDMNMFRSSDSDTITSVVESIIENRKIYVIEKGFEISKDNSQIIKCPEFSSEHALFASDAMLSIAIEEKISKIQNKEI